MNGTEDVHADNDDEKHAEPSPAYDCNDEKLDEPPPEEMTIVSCIFFFFTNAKSSNMIFARLHS